ncbi:MAG: hypothetical protein ACI39W_02395 [Brotaphodocola sp.]
MSKKATGVLRLGRLERNVTMRITEESMKQDNPELTGPGQMTDTTIPDPRTEQPKLTEREKLKDMSTQDKIWYIWAYYKWFFIAAAIAICVISSLGKAAYMSTFKTALHIAVVNNRGENETNLEMVTEDLHSWLNLGKKDRIITEPLFIGYGDDSTEYSIANMAKISAMASAQELDVMIGDVETIDHYASVGAFQDLETVLSPKVLTLVENHLYYAKDETGVSHACAVDISDTPFSEECQLMQEPPLIGVLVTSERNETSLKMIEYIFDQSTTTP